MRVKGIPVSETLSSRIPFDPTSASGPEEETTTSFTYTTQKFCKNDHNRRNRREGQILDLMSRVLDMMEKNERRMEDVDRKEVIKLEWQQAALVIDRWVESSQYILC
jgi:hypothetical protein